LYVLADVTINTNITKCRPVKIISMEATKNRTTQFQNTHVLGNKAHSMNCLIFYSMDAETLIVTTQGN